MSEPSASDATQRAWVALLRASARALAAVEADGAAAGLPPIGWYDLLLELDRAEHGALRLNEVERRLLLPQPNVSRLVDRLEARGLVERRPCPQDGRGRHVAITEAGRALRARMWPVYSAALARHVGAPLGSDAEAEALATLLERLITPPA